MANVRNSNTYYIDATGSITVKNLKVLYVVVTATSANAQVVLKDVTTGATKLDLRVATSFGSVNFDFSDNPVVFPNGIDVTTLTNAVATCIIEETRG